jgi:hypothetical protein
MIGRSLRKLVDNPRLSDIRFIVGDEKVSIVTLRFLCFASCSSTCSIVVMVIANILWS